jgi:hypothetical protein
MACRGTALLYFTLLYPSPPFRLHGDSSSFAKVIFKAGGTYSYHWVLEYQIKDSIH